MNCSPERDVNIPDIKMPEEETNGESFYFGADLSYVNQILDHGGQYLDSNEVENPYEIFKEYGNNLVRLRLWHNPAWTLDVYEGGGSQMYNDLFDVENAISRSKKQNMQVLLDFHYSDVWADPGTQRIPKAWTEIKDISVLSDSVYNYTFATLDYLNGKGLMPEFVQIGNETNCGMLYTDAPDDFPSCNGCDGDWANLRAVIKSGIKAIRDVVANSSINTKILLHVADPVNVNWWFENVMNNGEITDFDIIGFSYYPIWHTGVSIDQLDETVADFKSTYGKDIMILETAYPWTNEGDDNYGNIFGNNDQVSGYPVSPTGQQEMMRTITQNLKDGGGIGIIYWEPAWISSEMKDLWGTGSSWENNTFFDYEGNVNQAMDYMSFEYED